MRHFDVELGHTIHMVSAQKYLYPVIDITPLRMRIRRRDRCATGGGGGYALTWEADYYSVKSMITLEAIKRSTGGT